MTEMYSGLHVGQRFASLEEFKTVVRSISVRQHWELRVTRSNKKSVVIGCRSSANCYFRVVCRANKNATYITSLQDSHSCRRNEVSPGATPARSEASHVRFLLTEIPKLFDMKTKIKGQEVVDAVKRYHGYDISMRQAQRALTKLQPRQTGHNEEASGHDMDRGVQQDAQHPHPESQSDQSGPAYADIPEQRWISDNIPSELIDIHQTEPQRSPVPPPPALHAPSVQHAPSLQHPGPNQPPEPPPLSHNLVSSNPPQPNFTRSAPNQIHATQTKHPEPQTQTPNSGHPHTSQLILSNFKIEFTCTTCGSLNQGYIPNQGNLTGGNYISSHTVPDQTAVPRAVGPSSQPGPGGHSNNQVGDASAYEGPSAIGARGMQPAWTTGALEVPIASTHT